jgi:hypothetical protein
VAHSDRGVNGVHSMHGHGMVSDHSWGNITGSGAGCGEQADGNELGEKRKNVLVQKAPFVAAGVIQVYGHLILTTLNILRCFWLI